MPGPAGINTIEHFFTAPLDHADPESETIRVFVRELRAPGQGESTPALLFLQGGPGFESPRPLTRSGWIDEALKSHRVLLLDQRGTGLSSPVSRRTAERFSDARALADYLALFRADAIVADCELIRRELLGEVGRWAILGQSFGGFCVFTYLSRHPDSLTQALVTGGIPAIGSDAESIYRRTYPKVLEANQRYFTRYPEDQRSFNQLATRLRDDDIRLPGGDVLSVERVQQLGLLLGASDGDELIHYLIESCRASSGPPDYRFLHGLERLTDYNMNPLFSILHEACYAQEGATRWAAQRVRESFPAFQWSQGDDVVLTGEMIYPWMFEQYRELVPFAEAAQLLADKDDWPALYDERQLARNTVPVAASVYFDDMYVDRELSLQTASRTGNLRTWITNEFRHNGLRADGGRILRRLLEMNTAG